MLTFITVLATFAAILLLAPIAMFCCEVSASLWPRREPVLAAWPEDWTCAVLMPAHNEQTVIERTLTTLLPTLPPQATVVVVADNCSDRTADIARAAGVTVLERLDETNRGKGFALSYGFAHLSAKPPMVVVILDADCQVRRCTIRRLVAAAMHTKLPVQGLNLCEADPNCRGTRAVSGLAFRFKNLVRALGLARLARTGHLTGTGIALPWELAERVSVASSNVVEDMQWGIDLALAGYPTQFLPEASVHSPLPQQRGAARTQRTRWEHGHLQTLFTQAPRLIASAVKSRRLDLLLLAFDLAIPPLSLLVGVTGGAAVVATLLALAGLSSWLPAVLLLGGCAAVALAVAGGWWRHCRDTTPLVALLAAPLYAAAKLPIYAAFLFKRQQEWVRTHRDAAPPVVR